MRFWNASSHSLVNSILFACCKALNNSRHLSVELEINQFKAVIRPVKCCISWGLRDEVILSWAWIFSGLASIPHPLPINTRNFSKATPKAHFNGFSFSWYFRSTLNISTRWVICSATSLDFTSISSMYASMVLSIFQEKILITSL